MQAIEIERTGGADVLELKTVPVPEPGPGQVLVKLEAAGINYMDVYRRLGTYPVAKFPFVPGAEGAGAVARCGPGVTDVSPGARVAALNFPGAYAEYAVAQADRLVPIPDGVPARTAAALMLQGLTAHYLCTSTFALQPGHTALVHAGAGGVGLLLTQLAQARGATGLTPVSPPQKAELSKRAGAAHTIDYTHTAFAPAVRELTGGRGVDVVYDSVGKTTWEGSLDSLCRRGYFVLFGASSGPVPPFDLQLLFTKGSLFATRPTLVDYAVTREELTGRANELFAAVAAGSLALRAEHIYPLAEARRAHEDLEGRRTTGKLLLVP